MYLARIFSDIVKALHPYYKLAYIKLAWGGADEQMAERAAGNYNAKNWQDEAQQILETAVSYVCFRSTCLLEHYLRHQMEEYWRRRPRAPSMAPSASNSVDVTVSSHVSFLSEYDRYRQTLVATEDDEGWAAELRRYLKDMPADVTKDTDIVEWWQVCSITSRKEACLR
jgi:hypothetical protein